jgi:Mn-dependent DtxR family transcriptional regulator
MNGQPAMRRYAAEIYRFTTRFSRVPASLVSEKINASAQATSQMIAAWNGKAILQHEPYRGVRLTPAGETSLCPLCAATV